MFLVTSVGIPNLLGIFIPVMTVLVPLCQPAFRGKVKVIWKELPTLVTTTLPAQATSKANL